MMSLPCIVLSLTLPYVHLSSKQVRSQYLLMLVDICWVRRLDYHTSPLHTPFLFSRDNLHVFITSPPGERLTFNLLPPFQLMCWFFAVSRDPDFDR